MPASFFASPGGAALIGGGLGLLGGIMQGESSQNAANTVAGSNLQAAQLAAEQAKFRPVGITTRYGTSQFQMSPQGYLTGAGYMASPELQAMQARVDALNQANLGYAEQAPSLYAPLLTGAQGLFNQANLGLKATPEQQAADWMQKQQALIAPSREQAWSNLSNQLQNTGRTGLSVAQGGGLMSANPEASALANAQAMQDLQLAAQATQAGQQATNFYGGMLSNAGNLTSQYGQGLTGGYAPFSQGINVGQSLESIAQTPLTLGAGLGGQSAAYGASAGRFIAQGAEAATPFQYKAASYNPLANVLQGIGTNPYAITGAAKLFGGNTAGNWSPGMFQNQQLGMYGGGNAGFGGNGGFFD
jgi:hypothetical protein